MILMRPISAIIPTANRAKALSTTLKSLADQSMHPAEIIVIDASDTIETLKLCDDGIEYLKSKLVYQKALHKGAASQRNEGIANSQYDFILLMDDDIVFEPFCLERLWNAINTNNSAGAVNTMVTNQRYLPPGNLTRIMYWLMSGKNTRKYAGKCIGPAWNLLPEDGDNLPVINKMEWLNTTCTLYRKKALPSPVFPDHFKGYSMMEDLMLSLVVGREWQLYNVRNARIFHDSQPGSHKSNVFELAKMELVNRAYVMSTVLYRNKIGDYMKMLILESFFVLANLRSWSNIKVLHKVLAGKIAGIYTIITERKSI